MEQQISRAGRACRTVCRKSGPSFAQAVVAHLYGVPPDDLRASKRGDTRTAFARQVAMYLVHVVYGMSLTDVALAFGRDRSTASHAFHRIEDMRDDPVFDRLLSQLESLLRAASMIEVAS